MLKRVLFSVVVIAGLIFALNDVTIPYNFTANTPARSAEVNQNFDSVEIGVNRIIDSLDKNFIRYSDFDSSDTMFNKIWVDTALAEICSASVRMGAHFNISDSVFVTGNANIAGYLNITGQVKSTTIDADSVYSTKINGVTVVSGNVSCDSVSALKTISNIVSADSVYSNVYSGTNLNSDTIIALKVISAIGAIDTLTTEKITSQVSDIGAVTATTINTGNGDNELYAMDQNVLATSDVTFDSLTVNKFTANEFIIDTLQTFMDTVFSNLVSTGQGYNELYAMDQAVRTTDDVIFDSIAVGKSTLGVATATTLNTGNGANELYPMNQSVLTTSDVTFDDLTADTIYQSDMKVYGKGDSLLYAKDPAGIEFLMNLFRIVTNNNLISRVFASDSVYSATSATNQGLRVSNLSTTTGSFAGFGVINGSAQTYLYGVKTSATSGADLAIKMRDGTTGTRFEHSRFMNSGEICLNNTTSSTTPSGGAYLYATGGRLFAKDTTGQRSELTAIKGTFTCTLTSFIGNPIDTINYSIRDSLVTLSWGDINGTTDAAIVEFNSLPSFLIPNDSRDFSVWLVDDSVYGVVLFRAENSASGGDIYISGPGSGSVISVKSSSITYHL